MEKITSNSQEDSSGSGSHDIFSAPTGQRGGGDGAGLFISDPEREAALAQLSAQHGKDRTAKTESMSVIQHKFGNNSLVNVGHGSARHGRNHEK